MNTLIYWLGRAFIAFIQALPLLWVARMGRAFGALACHLDARHRRVVRDNLTQCFGREKSPAEIQALAAETFRRIGENYLCAIKTSAMSIRELEPHVTFKGLEQLPPPGETKPMRNVVVAIGHFGNFELYARFQDVRTDYRSATTYRSLKQPAMDRLLQELRAKTGCHYFERRTGGTALRAAMNEGGIFLGLLADQSSKGMRAPFLGRDCNTGLAPAILAQRYDCDFYSAICYRTGLAQWSLELGAPIATHQDGRLRSSEDIMSDVNRAFEVAIRRDPANWFWVHRRWKN